MTKVIINEKNIIDRIINSKSLDIVEKYDIKIGEFKNCKAYAEFIVDYNTKYNEIPSESIMAGQFNEYINHDLDAPDKFIAENFLACKHYNAFGSILEQTAKLCNEKDSLEGLAFLEQKLSELQNPQLTQSVGYDIVANAMERYETYLRKGTEEGKDETISFGIKELDKELVGIEKDDYLTIVARPNMGK